MSLFSGKRVEPRERTWPVGADLAHPPMHREFRGWPETWHYPEISHRARIEAHVIVEQGIGQPTRVGASWLMHRVTVGHDVQIGDGCEIATGTVIGAHSVIEDGARLGIGVIVKPFCRVGKGALVGHGAVVTKDVPAGETWISNVAAARMVPKAVLAANDNLTESELTGWEKLRETVEQREVESLAAAAGIHPEEWRALEESWSRASRGHPCA